MGTSNWQNIPFCIDIFRKFVPKSILDVGVGFGRWGILAHEFLDVWYDRDSPKEWQIRVEGIEVFKEAISSYHYSFYNKIYFGDAFAILPKLKPFDLVILGDVLEHFTPQKAEMVLNQSKVIGKFVMLIIPLGYNWHQDVKYGNPFEAHKSIWTDSQFATQDLLNKKLFQDFSGRPFGVYLFRGSIKPPATKKSITANNRDKKSEEIAHYLYRYFLRHPTRGKLFKSFLYLIHKIA